MRTFEPVVKSSAGDGVGVASIAMSMMPGFAGSIMPTSILPKSVDTEGGVAISIEATGVESVPTATEPISAGSEDVAVESMATVADPTSMGTGS
jgi:hypothetical protein